ncbi:HAD-IIIC family phosphatase [Shouchella hunanensis]|uniref:HAD-IIIC family phosphatase n=1 Tax=Shouchella hunanensis TaxID=766894 RepID=A0ABY7W021_9BACI|nr:HAD-IIIC family phosphatase [Shouchella hunanensis]WDF02028.1 HAD-IIIC family phosphatase [Shouchella hunanensis]
MKLIKCVIWDLDNTLWEGTLLEDNSVRLKDGIREILEKLDSEGVLLSIASRNNFEHAMDILKKLGIDHYFLYPQINWSAKSLSIKNIQKEINVGFDSLLFIDDQQFELDEVKSVYPEINLLKAENYREVENMQQHLPKMLTLDSKRRRLMFVEEQKRRAAEEIFEGPSSKFLFTLNMEFLIKRATQSDLMRAEELTVRTNQLNSTGIQYSYDELNDYLNSQSHDLWICELKDRYGSYGKIGLALVENDHSYSNIRLLLMSCRTLSRGVGTVLLSFLMKNAIMNNKKLRADFCKTERNRQMYLTYKFANFNEVDSSNNEKLLLENDLSLIQEYPPYIKVIIKNNRNEGVSIV